MRAKIVRGLIVSSLLMPSLAAAQDSYQWLEAPRDPQALAWAKQQSDKAKAEIAAMPGHAEIEAELKSVLAASDPPPQFELLGPIALKFQKSVAHPHGILSVARRSRTGVPGPWREVLDVDALRKAEAKPYELQLSQLADSCLPPAYERCMLSLSPAGSDDVELREFDLEKGAFVTDGFRVPASRNYAVWMSRDQLLIEDALGDAPRLATGWPASVALWRRGTPLTSARIIYQAQPKDAIMTITATGEGQNRVGVISRWSDYSNVEMSLVRPSGSVEKTRMPARQKLNLSPAAGGRIIAQLAEAAEVDGRTIPAETVISYDTAANVPSSKRIRIVYRPAPGDFISDPFFGISAGKSIVRFVVDRHGVTRLDAARFVNGGWQVGRGRAEPIGTTVGFAATDKEGDQAVIQRTGYLLPTRLELRGPTGTAKTLFSDQPSFDASNFVVELKTTRSKDGTEIDYFFLRPKRLSHPGQTPTLMTGYGAFGLTFSPGYLDFTVGGKSLVPWLNRGGALVLPLIRGGGDRGEAWHLAAIREKRQNSYDDFAAVTEALIRDGFTTPGHIGVFGTSNGGLLAAVMGTERPDLYGAVVSDVPLTDLLRMPYMGMGAAWVNEYGDPSDPVMRAAIERYSPFQNVVAGKKYPPFLITVSTSDNRVGPGHARKLAARLMAVGAQVYYLEDREGGHGVSDPLTRPDLMADRMTVLIDALGAGAAVPSSAR